MKEENFATKTHLPDDTRVLVLSGSFAGQEIEDAFGRLSLMMLGSSCHIIIDCQGVHEIDDKGLKFLCSAHRHILSRGRSVDITGLAKDVILKAREQSGRFAAELSCKCLKYHQCFWKI